MGSRREVAEPLERGQVGVHGGRRREADGLADLAYRRRIAAFAHVGLDDVEDLALAGREEHVVHARQRTDVR